MHRREALGALGGDTDPAAGGTLLLVEYDTDHGNMWVPHPLSYPAWERLAARAGLVGTRLLERYAGSFMSGMYSALSTRP